MAIDAAEERARELLLEVVGPDDYEVYERFGFLAVAGANARYSYLVYPYRPLVAYETASGELFSEFCVRYEDDGERLPPADDVLARWMALRGGERDADRRVEPESARAPGRPRSGSPRHRPGSRLRRRLSAAPEPRLRSMAQATPSCRARVRPPSSTAPIAPLPAPT